MSWQSMETAPKDGTPILVALPGTHCITSAHWCDDMFARKPRPYWERCVSITVQRSHPPIAWQPLPRYP